MGSGLRPHLCGTVWLKVKLTDSKLLISVSQGNMNERINSLDHDHKIYTGVNEVYTHTRGSSMEKFYQHMTLS